MSRLGFIGTGAIAAPMIRHLAAKGYAITATHRNTDISAALVRDCGIALASPQAVIDAADVVFLCLRPQVAEAVIDPLRFRAEQRIVSVMAAVPRARLEALCAPAADFVQTIPMEYLALGGCPLAAYGDHALLAEFFAPENPVVPVASEDALNAHFAICAMVSGFLDLMATGAGWLGGQTGDTDAAEFYATQLISGYLATMEKNGAGSLIRERDELATEATLSLQLTTALRTGGAHEVLAEALEAIGQRLAGA